MRNTMMIVGLVLFLPACAAKTQAPAPTPTTGTVMVTDSVKWNGDEDLAPLLVRPELNKLEMDAAERIEMRLGNTDFAERLGVVAEDSTAPWLVRINALRLLADRGALIELPSFVTALHASDERVRIAAVSGMREFMAVRPEAATEILGYALNDPSIRVQTAALQLIGDRDVQLLRGFYARTSNAQVRTITMDLIRAAEERGAPLVQKDGTGTLERTTSNGTVLLFRPTTYWKNWHAGVGNLIVALPKQKPVEIAAGVEAVGNVVPAFFSTDGNTLVYEVNREVHARNLVTGEDHKLADGIAPRFLPFTDDIIYMTEIKAKRISTPNSVGLKYDVMRIPVAGGTATSIGQVGASATNDTNGNYSPIRWAHISEEEGTFTLMGDTIDPFPLPSPFTSK